MHLPPQVGDVLACIGLGLRVDLAEPSAASSSATWLARRLIHSTLSSCIRLFAACLGHLHRPRPEDLPKRVEPVEA